MIDFLKEVEKLFVQSKALKINIGVLLHLSIPTVLSIFTKIILIKA